MAFFCTQSACIQAPQFSVFKHCTHYFYKTPSMVLSSYFPRHRTKHSSHTPISNNRTSCFHFRLRLDCSIGIKEILVLSICFLFVILQSFLSIPCNLSFLYKRCLSLSVSPSNIPQDLITEHQQRILNNELRTHVNNKFWYGALHFTTKPYS